MVLSMPRPFKHPRTGVYWYRQRVPVSLLTVAKGKRVTVTIDGLISTPKIGNELTISLDTKDVAEAKRRGNEAQAEFDRIWLSFEDQPVSLTLRQAVALAGEYYHVMRNALEDDPGESAVWARRAREWDAIEERKQASPYGALMIGQRSLEDRLGTWVDGALSERHLVVDAASRNRLLEQFDKAAQDLALLLERRGGGDYGPDQNAARFPVFEAPVDVPLNGAATAISFGQIIEAEEERRAKGRDAKALPPATVRKFKFITQQLASHRGQGGDDASTLAAKELEAWRDALQTSGENGNRTITDKLTTIKTVIGWGKARFKDSLRLREVALNIAEVEAPDFVRKPSDESAVTPEEAVAILQAARQETQDPRTRWLPWLCAFTGLRIGEASALEKADFFESEGLWFFEVSSSGKRSLKTLNARRKVPVHPALLAEGLRRFVEAAPAGRLFSAGAPDAVRDWIRGTVGIKRAELSPNHGWRHLFEDLCRRDHVSDDARLYLQGRSTGGSDQAYGRTRAMLPGLWREVAKIVPFPVDERPNAPKDDSADRP